MEAVQTWPELEPEYTESIAIIRGFFTKQSICFISVKPQTRCVFTLFSPKSHFLLTYYTYETGTSNNKLRYFNEMENDLLFVIYST